jgi:hypothetical protein
VGLKISREIGGRPDQPRRGLLPACPRRPACWAASPAGAGRRRAPPSPPRPHPHDPIVGARHGRVIHHFREPAPRYLLPHCRRESLPAGVSGVTECRVKPDAEASAAGSNFRRPPTSSSSVTAGTSESDLASSGFHSCLPLYGLPPQIGPSRRTKISDDDTTSPAQHTSRQFFGPGFVFLIWALNGILCCAAAAFDLRMRPLLRALATKLYGGMLVTRQGALLARRLGAWPRAQARRRLLLVPYHTNARADASFPLTRAKCSVCSRGSPKLAITTR